MKILEKNSENAPVASFKPSLKGQGWWIYHHLKEKKVQVTNYFGELQIYSKSRIPLFHETIKESVIAHAEKKEFDHEQNYFYKKQTLICVGIKSENKIYVTEAHFSQMVELQYEGKIPYVKEYMIFNTQKEMQRFLVLKNIWV